MPKTREIAQLHPNTVSNYKSHVKKRTVRIAEYGTDEPQPKGTWEEVRLSDCRYGCKVYENKKTKRLAIFHNATYGCKKVSNKVTVVKVDPRVLKTAQELVSRKGGIQVILPDGSILVANNMTSLKSIRAHDKRR